MVAVTRARARLPSTEIREMYLTARRQTRTEPKAMPVSLGFSQKMRELTTSLDSHMTALARAY